MDRNTNPRRARGQRGQAGTDRASLYDEVTGRIIADLEAGHVPWVQPWGRAIFRAAGAASRAADWLLARHACPERGRGAAAAERRVAA